MFNEKYKKIETNDKIFYITEKNYKNIFGEEEKANYFMSELNKLMLHSNFVLSTSGQELKCRFSKEDVFDNLLGFNQNIENIYRENNINQF